MTARLGVVLGAAPTAEQLAYGVAHPADNNNDLKRGAMVARLTQLLGKAPTKKQVTKSLGHSAASNVDLQAAI